MEDLVRVNLGSGKDYRLHWINVDGYYEPADMKFNLAVFPYPFMDNTITEIFASHILEHLPSTVDALEEWWRICKPGAKITIRVPHYSHIAAYENPTHKRFFTLNSLDYFTEKSWERYGEATFKIIRKELVTVPRLTDSRKVCLHAGMVNRIIGIHPMLERFMVLFGGISEIVWELEVVK